MDTNYVNMDCLKFNCASKAIKKRLVFFKNLEIFENYTKSFRIHCFLKISETFLNKKIHKK